MICIWFPWTPQVLALNFVKKLREPGNSPNPHLPNPATEWMNSAVN